MAIAPHISNHLSVLVLCEITAMLSGQSQPTLSEKINAVNTCGTNTNDCVNHVLRIQRLENILWTEAY